MISVEINGHTVPVTIIRRKGARRLRLRVDHCNQVVVSMPWLCAEREALKFVHTQGQWLAQQLARVPPLCPLRQWLRQQPELSASGQRYAVQIEASEGRRADYSFEPESTGIALRIPRSSVDPERTLLRLVQRFAADVLADRLACHAQQRGLQYTSLTIRDQATRWGSCSSRGTISLNWRLVLVAPQLQDYVLLHELAHLTEMNHSKRFWALLDDYDPAWRLHEAQLNAVAAVMMRVGRVSHSADSGE